MKVIGVYYKEIKLGELTWDNNYVYNAFLKNIVIAHKKGYPTYLYSCDESFISDELPYSLQNYVPNKSHIQIIQEAGILETDNDFEKLYKIAKLPYERESFYVKA